MLNADPAGVAVSQSVVTDSLRRRVRNFGEIRVEYSPTLTAADQAQTFDAADDFLQPGWRPYLSVAQYQGIADVTASSSAADISAIPTQSATGLLPFSAIDGNLETMWESGGTTGPIGQWIQVDFGRPVRLSAIRVAFADNAAIGPPVARISVSSAIGRRTDLVRQTGNYQSAQAPAGSSTWIRITVTGTAWQANPLYGSQVGIAEIAIPGVRAARTIVAPDVPMPGGGDPSAVVLAKAEPQPSGCMLTSVRWACSPSLVKPTEEQYGFDEGFTAAAGEAGTLTGTAVLSSQALINRYIYKWPGQPQVSGSASYTADPEDMPAAAFDGNLATTWISGPTTLYPRLTIRWHSSHVISAVNIVRPGGAAAPAQVLITGSHRQLRGGIIGASGVLKFAPIRTRSLTFRFTPTVLPMQVSDVFIPGVQPLAADPSAPVRLHCGLGPQVQLNGVAIRTSAAGTVRQLLTGQPIKYKACGLVTVQAGQNRMVEPAADNFEIQAAVIDQTGPAAVTAVKPVVSAPAKVVHWTNSARAVRVSAAQASYLVLDQNYNAGWQARTGGRVLSPVELDGWKQAWLLPAGTSGLVTLTFLPDATYRAWLVVGFGLLALVLLCAVLAGRRRRARGAVITVGTERGAPAALAGQPEYVGQAEHVGQARAAAPESGDALTIPLEAVAVAAGGRWRRLVAVVLLPFASFVLLCAAGLWLGGYPAAIGLPAVTGIFALALARSGRGRAWLELSRPWIPFALLVAAAGCVAAGELLTAASASSAMAGQLESTWPQVICLVIVARLAAALIGPEPPLAEWQTRRSPDRGRTSPRHRR